jgi:hypothetical protein
MTAPMGTDTPGGTNIDGAEAVVTSLVALPTAELATAMPRSTSDSSLRSRERRARTFFRRGPQSRVMTDERPRVRGRAGGVA